MNWDQIEGNWKQFKGKAKEQWDKLTDDNIEMIAGKRDQLVRRIQESYGITKEEAEFQIREWVRNQEYLWGRTDSGLNEDKMEACIKTKQEPPIRPDDLLSLDNMPASEEMPNVMRSYKATEGIIFEMMDEKTDPEIGFRRLETSHEIAAWTLSSSHSYRLGLPVRSAKCLSVETVPTAIRLEDPISLNVSAVHFPWNTYIYHPKTALKNSSKALRSRDGKRNYLTDAIDAIIFGVDNRRVYYPAGYPWHCIGKVEVWADGQNKGSGTGTLVGRNIVLTCSHIIPWGAMNWSIKFTPALYGSSSLLGASFYSWTESVQGYNEPDHAAWDMALLRLYQPLGDHLGYMGVRTYNDDWDDEPYWTACGYPAMIDSERPSYLNGIEIDDTDNYGNAVELDSENQDNSKGNSGGPLWANWANGPYIIGVVSRNEKIDYVLSNDYNVLSASGKAMVDMVGRARIELNDDLHIIRPPNLNMFSL